MFSNCFSLSFLPDLEKWNTSNINHTINKFNINCIPLIYTLNSKYSQNSIYLEDYDYSEDYDIIFKILVIGEIYVGKSSLIERFIEDSFSPDMQSTIGK